MEKYYPIVVFALDAEDGPGYYGIALDLKGCVSHGETPEEAFTSTREAVLEWLEEAEATKRPIPAPGTFQKMAQHEREGYSRTIKELRDLLARLQDEHNKVQLELNELRTKLTASRDEDEHSNYHWASKLVAMGYKTGDVEEYN